MLGENIKRLRKQKGISQEELAIRLHVVRQTVSKWERDLSVPDAELLQRMADLFEVRTDALLGGTIPDEPDRNELAEQLSRINEQLAIRNRRSRRIWKTIAIILASIVALWIILTVLFMVDPKSMSSSTGTAVTTGEYTDEDIDGAFAAVSQYVEKFFPGCTLQTICYDGDMRFADLWAEGEEFEGKECIVIKTDVLTGPEADDPGIEPNTEYPEWKWLLVKENGAWTVKLWGTDPIIDE